MHKIICTIGFLFITTTFASAADPNFDNWNDIEEFDFNIQTRKKNDQQAPTLQIPDPNKPAAPEAPKIGSQLDVKNPPEVSVSDVPNPPEAVKHEVTPDEQLKKDLEETKKPVVTKGKSRKPVIIKEAPKKIEPKRFNSERKSIDKSEPVSAFFDDNELLEKSFAPRNSEARRVYDARQAPSEFMQHMQRGETNKHLPNLVYQKEFSELLFAAVMRDDLGAINSLLARGADINSKVVGSGVTPLISAIKLNNIRTVRYLLTRGADVNITMVDGKTPLHIAATSNNTEVFNLLLSAGAKALLTDHSGKYPLDYVNPTLRATFELAIAQHVTDKNKALLDFVNAKSIYPVKYLLDDGVDVNFRELSTGDTALIKATRTNNLEMVNLLLARNANINLVNNKGETALKIAQTNKFAQIGSVIDTVSIRNELESTSIARKFEPLSALPIQPVEHKAVEHKPAVEAVTTITTTTTQVTEPKWISNVTNFFDEINHALKDVMKVENKTEATPVEVKTEKLPELNKQTIIYNKSSHQVSEPFAPKHKLPPNIVKKVIRDGEEVTKTGAGDWVRVPTKEEMQPTPIIPEGLD